MLAACATFKQQETSEGGASDDGGSAESSPAADSSPGMDAAGGSDSGGPEDSGSSPDGGEGGCVGASCPIETVVSGLRQGTLVRVDTSNVYFGDEGTLTGNVYECPKSGCATPLPLGPGYATGLGVDGTNVYWNDFSAGKVVACTIGGCNDQPTVLAPNQVQAEAVTFDGTNLYWATSGTIVTCVPPACSPRTAIATGLGGTVVEATSRLGVAYWVSGGTLEFCPVGGCAATPTKISAASGTGVVLDDNGHVYFTRGNAVVSCPAAGLCATPHTIGASDDPYGLGTDGVDVYWLDDLDQVVFRCPVSGCSAGPEHFADGQLSQPGANVALDGEYAYWTVPEAVLRKHK